MATLSPLTFEPILHSKVWGGRRLAQWGKNLPSDAMIGESWELADLPPEVSPHVSVIANGPLGGLTLGAALARHPSDIMGRAPLSAHGGFPLLIKYLDARENLSVQVHPTHAYARTHPGAHVKSEAWVVLEAEPDAVLYAGIRPDVTREQFEAHLRTGDIVNDLVAVPAVVGECHYLPSGLCHALGAGVMVAEVQTPSDTTFRLYDWGRADRPLHVAEAMECIAFGEQLAGALAPKRPHISLAGGCRTATLCETEHFLIERIDANAGVALDIVTNGGPVAWMIIAGRGLILTPGAENVPLQRGTTVLLPASINRASALFDTPVSLLRITLPSVLRGMLA